ncbi:hypothetical protein [Alteribacter keqinensis]|uniref:Uncharacterized protein n=1 Tax=Alteribacter keqinensis TaxID=2483800 RepID=A0A3M7TZJ9_9BACI|nr:hypothetical protein [Alteribacter keqinensis]RNA69865.1 hypothetical protein EBO34_08010 [Alteribacter keqinensis]
MSKKKKNPIPEQKEEKVKEEEKTLWSYWNQFMLGNNENQGEKKKAPDNSKEDHPPFWWI